MDYSYYISPHPHIDKKFYNITPKPPTWTTQSGDKILISQMETSHMYNTLKYFNRSSGDGVQRKLNQMRLELIRRGETNIWYD